MTLAKASTVRCRDASRRLETQSIFFLALSLFFACGQAPDRPPGYALVGLDSAPLSLDPRFSTDATAAQIEDLVFDSLTRIDGQQRRVGHLAQSWETPDATTYVFHLRPGLHFSDGSELTANDIKATYENVIDAHGTSPKREQLAAIRHIEAVDRHTVRFILNEPFAPFLSVTGLGILSHAQLLTAPTQPLARPIGSGPFRHVDAAEPETIALDRNPYYAMGSVRLSGIKFRIVPDAITRLLELRRGSLDLVQSGIEPDSVAWLRQQPGIEVSESDSASFQYLGLNLRHPQLADRRVRRAIAAAIDREALVHTILESTAESASGMLPPHHWAYEARTPRQAYDPSRARRLLDHAGLTDPDGTGPAPRLRLEYKTTTIELRRRIAEVLQAQLATVGIELDIRSYEWATFYSDIRRGNFAMYSLAWVGVEDPDLYFLSLHSDQLPPRGLNRGFYGDPTIDALTARARRTLDPERRRRLYAAVQVRAARDLPVIPLWWPANVVAVSQRLHGYQPATNGSYAPLQSAWLDEAR